MTGRPVRSTEHGQYGYARRTNCDCDACRRVTRRYAKELAYDNHNKRPRQVDAQPVRDHVHYLTAVGTPGMIAKATGGTVNRTQITRLLYGNPQTGKVVAKLHRHTAEALLAVTPQQVMEHNGFVHPAGSRRRVQALAAMGHGKAEIAAVLGIHWSNIYEYFYQDRIGNHVACRLKEVYDRLWDVQGGNEMVRWKARRLGYLPPLAWDDETIDDPMAEPDLEAIKCVVEPCPRSIRNGMLCSYHHQAVREQGGFNSARAFRDVVLKLNKAQIHEWDLFLADLRDCRELGMTAEEAARRLGRKISYVAKHWRKAAA